MSTSEVETQWFAATSGRMSGWMGVATGVVVTIIAVVSGSFEWILAGLLIVAVVWLVLLRPRVGLRGRTLLLRGIASTVEIPLSLVTEIRVRQVLAVWVGETRYVNPAIGRPLREVRPRSSNPQLAGTETYADPAVRESQSRRGRTPNPYVDQLLELIRSHRADALRWGDQGIDGGVRRHWAIPELSAIAVLAIALIVVAAL